MHKFMRENSILEQSSCAWVYVFKIKGIVTLPSAYPQPEIKSDPHILFWQPRSYIFTRGLTFLSIPDF